MQFDANTFPASFRSLKRLVDAVGESQQPIDLDTSRKVIRKTVALILMLLVAIGPILYLKRKDWL